VQLAITVSSGDRRYEHFASPGPGYYGPIGLGTPIGTGAF
jgi:hypothetical protein